MRPKPLEWRKWSSGLSALMTTRLGHYEITVSRDESKWVLWISRVYGDSQAVIVRGNFTSRVKAKAAGEEIWRRMVMELLEGDE